MYQHRMLLKLRKPILKYTLNKYHVHWLSSFNHLKLSISIEIPVTIYLHDSYITKLDFLNYAFAKLVLAWQYGRVSHDVHQMEIRNISCASSWQIHRTINKTQRKGMTLRKKSFKKHKSIFYDSMYWQ